MMANTLPAWAFDPFKGKGRVVYSHPDKVLWGLWVDAELIATVVQERVDLILDDNVATMNNNAGKRWGDGQIVAKIPLGFYGKYIMPAKQNGDEKYIKKILEDSDYSKFRSFPGKI